MIVNKPKDACMSYLSNTSRYLLLTALISGCAQLPENQTQHAKATLGQTTDTMHIDLSNRHEKTLKNGLRVIVKEDHRAPVVMTQVWYKVGSTDEPKGKGGISHVLEHMMFKGTSKVSGDDFNRIVSRFGGSQNAFTSHDYTGYYQFYPASRLSLALELEADRMRGLVLKEKDFKAERQVVMEERRQRTDDNPRARAYEQFRYLAFSQAAQRQPVIGKMSDINNISLNDLTSWYNQWYAPNNATVVIVGDVSAAHAFAQTEKYFGQLKTRPTPTRPSVREPQQQGKRHKQVALPLPVPTLYMGFNVPSLATLSQPASVSKTKATAADANETDKTQDAYTLALLQYILDGGLSARLEKSLVRDKKLLASVGTHYDFLTRGDGLFFISATPSQGVTLEQAQTALTKEINALKDRPITAAEIKRAKTNYLTSLIYQQDNISAQARMIGTMATIGLDDRLLADLPKRMGDITEDQLHRVAKTYLTPDNLTTFYAVPDKQGPAKVKKNTVKKHR